MPAISRSVVFGGHLSGATGPVSVGKALLYNAAKTRLIVSTDANRTSTGRKTAGIALTAGDDSETSIEVQFAGPIAPNIVDLGAGDESSVYVDSSGSLARGGVAGVDDIVGRCDEDGLVYLLCGGMTVAAVTVGGEVGDVQIHGAEGGLDGVSPGTANNVLVSDGTNWTSRSLSLDDLTPAFNITMGGAQTVEVGATVATPSFTATYTGGPATSATLTDNDGSSPKSLSSPFTSVASDASPAKTANNASVTYTITANNGAVVDSATAVIAWRPRVYWGARTTGAYNEAFIEGLASSALQSSRATSFTVNAGASQHIYYAVPTSYGTPTFFVGGFEGGFNLVGNDVSVTNANGVTQTYDLYESTNANLGSTTVTVT